MFSTWTVISAKLEVDSNLLKHIIKLFYDYTPRIILLHHWKSAVNEILFLFSFCHTNLTSIESRHSKWCTAISMEFPMITTDTAVPTTLTNYPKSPLFMIEMFFGKANPNDCSSFWSWKSGFAFERLFNQHSTHKTRNQHSEHDQVIDNWNRFITDKNTPIMVYRPILPHA